MNTNHKNKNTAGQTATPPVREMAVDLFYALILDIWPSSATVVDFGLDSTAHYGALQYEVTHRDVTMEELDDAMGNGPALTALIRPDNPYHGVQFETPWDGMLVSIRAWANAGPGGKFPLGRLFATPCA